MLWISCKIFTNSQLLHLRQHEVRRLAEILLPGVGLYRKKNVIVLFIYYSAVMRPRRQQFLSFVIVVAYTSRKVYMPLMLCTMYGMKMSKSLK